MPNKTIWIINQTAGKPNSGWGERHYFLSKQWVKKGYSVKIFSGSYNHLFTNQPKTKGWFTFEKVEENIEFCWIKVPKYKAGGFSKFWSNFVFMLRLFFLPVKEIEKPSAIIVSSMPIFPILNGVRFKKKFKAKTLITEVRDLWPLTPIYLKDYSKNHPLIKVISWFEKYAYQKSDRVVSLLPNAEEYINSVSKSTGKFAYIPNGIDTSLIKKENLSEDIIAKIPKDKFIIGYAGTIGFANAMEYFVEASLLSKDKDVHFVIVGDGVLKNKFKEQTKDSKNSTFIDKIPKQQVQAMLDFFDVCYVGRYKSPLYKYGVSYNKYFDYMLAKKPILESSEKIKSQTELAGCGLIVAPENSFAIIEGIKILQKKSNEELTEMGKRGKCYVEKYHTYQYLANLYCKLF